MATESPISLNGHSYLSGRSVIPNRSGSAPPNMEGSLASIENLMHKYGLDANLASLHRSHFHQSFPSGFDQRVVSSDMAKQLKSSSFRASSENFLQLYQTSLSTCKEESEDDKSPQKSSDDLTKQRSAVWSEQESNSCIGQSISVADHMKDDLTSISSSTSDQPNASCHGPDVDGSNSHENSTAVSAAVASDISVNGVASSIHVNHNSKHGSFSSIQTDYPNNRGLVGGEPDVVSIQSGIKAMKLAYPPNLEQHGGQGEWQNNFPTNMQYQVHQPSGNFQHQGSMPHIVSQGTVPSYVISDQILHGGKLSSAEAQPVLHSSVFAPPLYATASATYYAGYQPPGVVYSPHYGIGGYPYNSVPPPYFGGYPPHNAAPLAFDVINSPVSWVSTEEDVDMHHMNKLCGPPHGFMQHFVDPRLQFHPSFGDLYNIPDQADPLALRGGSQKQRASGQANVGQRTREIAETDFTASQTGSARLMHVPNLPRPNSLLPGSVTGVSNIPCGKIDVGLPNSGTNASFYTDWQCQRGFESFNHQERAFSYLEELKSGKGRRVDLSDIVGHMVEFSIDQHGSRFIQQKLEHCSSEEMACVFQEILPHACKLMADVFGNYVIQKFFEYGTCDQRKHLAYALSGQIVPLSLQMYGCRVIQKALDVIEVDQKIALVRELDGHVMRCVRDQNGNHVIQKCIGCIPTEKIGFIISAFRGQVANLSMHPYGCRVIQRVMEYCTDELQTRFIVDEILDSVCTLAHDQYGNYVTQHVLERGKPQERNQIVRNLSGKVVKMSQHKFASNVIEKCLEYADAAGRELLIGEVIGLNEGTDNLLVMMKDQYANYVVQKMLEKCTDAQRDLLLGLISVHLNGLKKYTYGKHIVSRFEQLFGELEAQKS